VSLKGYLRLLFGGKQMAALPAGKIAPTFSLQNGSGQKMVLAEALKKGPVLAAFFKVSCPVCQYTFPFLERMHETYGDSKFTILGISQNDAAETREFCREYGVKFPVLIDEDGYPVSNQYGLTNVPTVFLISPDGKIQESSVGFAKADLEKIAAEAARATGKSAVPLFKPDEVVPDFKPG
jgi:peroxiredoxin